MQNQKINDCNEFLTKNKFDATVYFIRKYNVGSIFSKKSIDDFVISEKFLYGNNENRTISTYLNYMVKLGYLKKSKRNNNNNEYEIIKVFPLEKSLYELKSELKQNKNY